MGGVMRVLITGGTGFVGKQLSSRLVKDGNEITILTRSLKGSEQAPKGVSYLQGDPTEKGPWQDVIANHDVVINLAGASIFSKWSDEYKKLIRDSRVFTTRNIIEGIPSQSGKKISLFSTSAVGYYGFHGDEELDEESPSGNDFLARLAIEWEAEALKAEEKGARVVITRFGIVLGEKGGALGQMIPLFKKFIGGPIGSSPNPVKNRDLAKSLGKVLHRPSFMPAPAFMIKLVLGEFGSVILEGQRVLPRQLLKGGFVFKYPDIEKALQNIIS
jgi:uncharacterized protein (TIGR01777 family)